MSTSEIGKRLRQAFQIDELSPEEYAGRFSHGILCLGIRFDQHKDPELEEWVTRLRSILDDEEKLNRLRQKYLSPEELKAIADEGEFD